MALAKLLDLFRKKQPPPTHSPSRENCCVCDQRLSGRIVRDAWNQAAHATHEVYFCNSCDRMLGQASLGAYRYSDGRLICGRCKKIAVTEGVAANRGRRAVLEILEGAGFTGIPKNVTVVLAHPKTLSSHSGKRHTAGLTLSHLHFNQHKRAGISHQIGVLYGLPKIEFEGVLAHELLHVWQQENDVKFSPLYREGLCELGSYLVYSQDGGELGRHFLEKMAKNKDPVYGNGFRLMRKKLDTLGWPALIREILANKRGLEASVLGKIMKKK